MKTARYIISFIAVFSFFSCEDALDRFPKDSLSPGTFFRNRTECELYTNTYYTMFPSASGIYGETADVLTGSLPMSAIIGTRTVVSTDSNWSWNKLRDINTFLQYSSSCEDEDVRLEFEGLSRFFRAYFYYEKIKRFGDVPWFDEPLDSDDARLYKARDPREYVMERMIEDIDFAIYYLPSTKSAYRVTRWTALALKTRFCLFEGTYRKYHGLGGHEPFLEAAVAAGNEFITLSGYTIYNTGATPYLDLFASMTTIDSEVILSRGYGSSLGLTHDVNGHFNSPTMSRNGLLKNTVNTYLMVDGTRFTDKPGWETMGFVEECEGRDKRLKQTIRAQGYTRIGSAIFVPPDYNSCSTGYHVIKFVNSSAYDGSSLSCNDMPVFRTAEVLLNYAEAKAELGTLTQDDLDKTVNLLRTRAGVAHLNLDRANADPDPYLSDAATGYRNVTGTNKGVILEIRRERTVELVCEGFRYWDIMRWKEGLRFQDIDFHGPYFPGPGSYDLDSDGTIDLCIWQGTRPDLGASVNYLELGTDITLSLGTSGNMVVPITATRKWDEGKDYLYPIPTDDRTLSSGVITQNPGWNDGLNF